MSTHQNRRERPKPESESGQISEEYYTARGDGADAASLNEIDDRHRAALSNERNERTSKLIAWFRRLLRR